MVLLKIHYFDIIPHLCAGLGIAFLLKGLVSSFRPNWNRRKVIFWGVIFIGIFWELLEMKYDIAGYGLWTKLYYFDTAKDLLIDIVGASVVAYFAKNKNKVNIKNES